MLLRSRTRKRILNAATGIAIIATALVLLTPAGALPHFDIAQLPQAVAGNPLPMTVAVLRPVAR